MTSLFGLANRLQELDWVLEQEEIAEGAHDDIVAFLVPAVEQKLNKKVDSYVGFCRALEATAKAQRKEAQHLTKMARANENRAKWLKDAAKTVAQKLGRERLEGETRAIVISETKRPKIELIDIDKVPAKFKQQIREWRVDKKAIADQVMATGEIPDGVSIKPIVSVRFR